MVAEVVDTVVDVQWNFIRQFVPTAKRNAKFLSNRAATVRSTAKIALPNARATTADLSDTADFALIVK